MAAYYPNFDPHGGAGQPLSGDELSRSTTSTGPSSAYAFPTPSTYQFPAPPGQQAQQQPRMEAMVPAQPSVEAGMLQRFASPIQAAGGEFAGHGGYYRPASASGGLEASAGPSSGTPVSAEGSKKPQPKKRKSTGPGASGTAQGQNGAQGDEADDDDEDAEKKAKRQKTTRACDQCRKKKIRCDPLQDTDPPLCTHCRSHKFECTWFLPISETRFKRSRPEATPDAPSNPLQTSAGRPSSATPQLPQQQHQQQLMQHAMPPQQFPGNSIMYSRPAATFPGYGQPPGQGTQPYGQPSMAQGGQIKGHSPTNSLTPNSNGGPGGPQRKEARVIGPTSITHLMHSTSTFPVEKMVPVDIKYAQTLSVGETGDGLIRVSSSSHQGDLSDGEEGEREARAQQNRGVVQGIESETADQLINYYFSVHANHFPIVSRADFLSTVTPSNLLFNVLCCVSACSHRVGPGILRTIKSTIRNLMREEDLLDGGSISLVQSLLVYAFSLEMERGRAGSKSWNVLGCAIRMAQDLGLHRAFGSEVESQDGADYTELRRRVWGGCVVADRWISCVYGLPMIIDLADCDCLLPSVFEVRPAGCYAAGGSASHPGGTSSNGAPVGQPPMMPSGGTVNGQVVVNPDSKPFLFNAALIELSILLGRIVKDIYSPTGILTLTAEAAEELIRDLNNWKANLPEELKFKGADESSSSAGFLHLLYMPVWFLITRPFMRISFKLPERFSNIIIDHNKWNELEAASAEAIRWVDKNEHCLEGWFAGSYAFFICALIQYHAYIRQRHDASIASLQHARDIQKRITLVDGDCHVRIKVAELLYLLYNTACSVSKWAPEAMQTAGAPSAQDGTGSSSSRDGKVSVPLNPTAGVQQRDQDWNTTYARDGTAVRKAYDTVSSLRSTHDPDEPISAPNSAPASEAEHPAPTFAPVSMAASMPFGSAPYGAPSMDASAIPEWLSSTNFNPSINNMDGLGGFGSFGGSTLGGLPAGTTSLFPGFDGFGGYGGNDASGGGDQTMMMNSLFPPEPFLNWDNWNSWGQQMGNGGGGQ